MTLQLFLDASHFGWVIVNHHNEVFADAFSDTMWTANEVRRLTHLRNEWAHIQDISLPQARRAADSMKGILASLRCEEALEIERMVNDLGVQPEEGPVSDFGGDTEFEETPFGSPDVRRGPWDLWHQLRAYLVVDKSVEFLQDERWGTVVGHRLLSEYTIPHLTAVTGLPFTSSLYGCTWQVATLRIWVSMEPGQSAEACFTFPVMRLVDVDIKVEYQVDGSRLWAFQHSTHLPADVIGPLQKEFVSRLEAVGIKGFH